MSLDSPLLAKLADALSALTQDKRILQQHVGDAAPSSVRSLVPYQLAGNESVCGGVSYVLQTISRSADVPLKDLVGLPMAVSIADDRGGPRIVAGFVCRPEALVSDGANTLLQAEIRDAFGVLSLRKNRRIFRDQSVVDVVGQILDEHIRANGVLASGFRYDTSNLHRTYPVRAMLHQAGESDAAYIKRLLRQEGIAWHFTFGLEDGNPIHTLVLSDGVQAFKPNPAGTVRFHRADATEKDDTVVAWQSWRELAPGGTQRDQFDYKSVRVRQAQETTLLDQGEHGDNLARTLTDYHYDAAFLAAGPSHQGQMSRSRIQAHEFMAKGFRGESVVRQFACGTTFELTQHHGVDTHAPEDRRFTLTSLHVYARNNVRLDERLGRSLFEGWQYHVPRTESDNKAQAGGHNDSMTEAPLYYNRFECVRSSVPIVPDFDPDRDVPRIHFMSAIVEYPDGQEVAPDELGRVPVRMLFNHEETALANHEAMPGLYNTAMVRVLQPFAGADYGTTFWPRQGMEVMLGFTQGDPDKAFIIGAPYNGNQDPAKYAHKASVPANAPLTGIRTKEIQGERYNHLRFSDFPSQIGVQAATDHAATQLNMGWLGTPHDEGSSDPRGEGFEVATDASGAIRAARALLISAFARLQASGKQLDIQETLTVMQECVTLFKELGQYAAQHEGMAVDTQAQLEQQAKLQNWENGSNTKPGANGTGQGGAPMVTITAPDGLHNSTPASVVTHAGQNVDTVASAHIQNTSGGRTITNAGQGVSTFAQSGGVKTVAHQGDHVMQSQSGNTFVQSAQDIGLAAAQSFHLAAGKEVVINVGGCTIKMADGRVDIIAPTAFTVHSPTHNWNTSANAENVELPQFSIGQLSRTPQAVRATDGEALPNVSFEAMRADGSVTQGQTGADGATGGLSSQALEVAKLTLKHAGPETP
ncbi:MAG: type VI secretion system Vgr family protein [Aquabacterium sp.]